MLSIRLIPTLLLRNSGLVKGSQFRNHKYVGDPINAVKIYNDKNVDELIFLDITASLENKEPNFEFLSNIASQAFMPFGYGGGIKTVKHIETLFRIGIEKVILNTVAVSNIALIKEASKTFGSQSVIVSIDVKKTILGKHKVFTYSGTYDTKFNPMDYAKMVTDAGAGEIMITSIDREGTGKGYDLELIRSISGSVDIPVIASGGAGNFNDFSLAIEAGASAVAAGDMFIFQGKLKAVLITYPEYRVLEELFKRKGNV